MSKHTFKLSDVTGDTRGLARLALGYDWNYLADAETLLFGSTDETAFRMQNMSAGAGITDGTGTLYKANVTVAGDLITTTIVIDLTGLRNTAAGDIIGVDGTSSVCHIGQITAALNGTIFAGDMTCLETPAGGEPDIDLYAASEGTGVEDGAIGDLTETALVTAGQDWISTLSANQYNAAGLIAGAVPDADEYLYLVGGGGTTDADYTAGIFRINLYGYPA